MTSDEYNRAAYQLERCAQELSALASSRYQYVILEAWRRRAQSYRELAKRETDEG